MEFENKHILITGASGGIGQAIAKDFLAKGAILYISGSNAEKLQKFNTQELGGKAKEMICNLKDAESVESLISSMPQIDVLVCNAGITKDTLAMRMSNEDFTSVIDINLNSNFILNREAIKKMIRARSGRIINIASVVAVSGNPGQANYCASKAGLIGMSKALAKEVAGKNITINVVAPGFIKTNMTDALNDAQKEAILQNIPAKKMGTAEDIAYAVSFLSSDKASYITGQTLHINGGMLMI